MAVYASFTGSAALHQVGVQAVYICSLGVILWRMKDALQAHLSAAMSSKNTSHLLRSFQQVPRHVPNCVLSRSCAAEARELTDGREEQNKKLRALVVSQKQQLEYAKAQRRIYMQQVEEMRKNSTTAGKAEEHLQQQVRCLHMSHLSNSMPPTAAEYQPH